MSTLTRSTTRRLVARCAVSSLAALGLAAGLAISGPAAAASAATSGSSNHSSISMLVGSSPLAGGGFLLPNGFTWR